MQWIAAIDMDGTLLTDRTLSVLCTHLGLTSQLQEIDSDAQQSPAYEISHRIARLFAGYRPEMITRIFDAIPLVEGAPEFIQFLKARNFVTAIITEAFDFLALRLATRLGIDLVIGNHLEQAHGVLTGNLIIPPGSGVLHHPDCRQKSLCKLVSLNELVKQFKTDYAHVLAVGDSLDDICMIKQARIGVSFRALDPRLDSEAHLTIRTDFNELREKLEYLPTFNAIHPDTLMHS